VTRRVVILKDEAAPLWFIRCAEPCQADGWCMRDHLRIPTQRHRGPVCYLGAASSPERCAKLAAWVGYEVVDT